MKKSSTRIILQLIITTLLITTLSAVVVGTPEKTALAQKNNPAPIITLIFPAEAAAGESLELTISGEHFLERAQIRFSPPDGIKVNRMSFFSPEKMKFEIEITKDASTGARDVTIANPDQQSYTAKASFHIKAIAAPLPSPLPIALPPPAIASLSPADAYAGEIVELVITGKYFNPDFKLAISPPEGVSISQVKFLSAEKISAVIAIVKDAQEGPRDVTVSNPDGQSHTVKATLNLKAVFTPSSAITDAASPRTTSAPEAVPAESAIKNIPGQSLLQKFRQSTHRLITGIGNRTTNWIHSIRIQMSDKAIEDVQRSAFTEISRPSAVATLCPEPQVVNYQALRVSSGETQKRFTIPPDGSVARPFPTIVQALEHAERLHYEGVEIIAARGTYTGDLNITRPTKITGASKTGTKIAGSVINNSVYGLVLDTLSITGPTATSGDVGRQGAVAISNICASTTIKHVIIAAPLNCGITQTGGKLNAKDVKIRDTAAAASDESSGAAVRLSQVDATLLNIVIERSGRFGIRQIGGSLILYGTFVFDTQTREELSKAGTGIWTSDGAKTDISDSYITGSLSSALIVQGRDTKTSLRWAAIFANKPNPWLVREHALTPAPGMPVPAVWWIPGGYAAVEVQEGARLIIDESRITDNEYLGIRVTEGSQARVTNTLFSHTRQIPDSEQGFGTNIQAKNNGYMYLENVTSSHADLCGLQLYGGTADYHVGEVSYNTVGVNVQTPGFDLRRLQDRVRYFANGMDLDMNEMPVPDISIP